MTSIVSTSVVLAHGGPKRFLPANLPPPPPPPPPPGDGGWFVQFDPQFTPPNRIVSDWTVPRRVASAVPTGWWAGQLDPQFVRSQQFLQPLLSTLSPISSSLAPSVVNLNVNFATPSVYTSTGQYLGAVVATNSPTSWSILSGDPGGYFSITSAGKLTLTSTGVADVTDTTYTLTVQATNTHGSGTGTVTATPWPDASNTGPRISTTPTASNNITSSGTYSGLHFTGTVTISANNVTLVDCLVTANTGDNWSIGISGNHTGIVIQNVEIAGAGTAGPQGTYGIYGINNSVVQVIACHIHDVGQGIVMNDGQWTLTATYIHSMNAGSGTHYECIGYFGAATSGTFSLSISGCSLVNQQNQTASIFTQNYFGALYAMTFTGNLLIGGDYTIYVDGTATTDSVTGVSITNNFLGIATFGYDYPGAGSNPNYHVTWSGNVDWITGATVPQ